jgi:hypothetical protein
MFSKRLPCFFYIPIVLYVYYFSLVLENVM